MSPVLLPVPGDPTVTFSVSFAVGSQDDPPGREGLASLTGQMLAAAATRQNSYEAILERLYPLAADYRVRVDRERTTLSGRVHRDRIDEYAALFTEAFLEPAFAADDFERLKSDAANHLAKTLRYSSDEELAKAVLYSSVFAGTRYAHPEEGTLAGLEAITLDDVRAFYAEHMTGANATLGLGGGFDDALTARMGAAIGRLPAGQLAAPPAIEPRTIRGAELVLVDKPGADASISLGFPLDVRRGERDFYALAIANSWLGEHRNSASHLYQVIREARGLNYGDYSYIECFPEGGERQMPPVNVPRRRQLFEIWIRTLPNAQAPFALKAALRELKRLVENGLSREDFELTRAFLSKYSAHFAETTSARLGYAVDDRFYGIDGEGHLDRFRRMMGELTHDEVNAAVARHLQHENLRIAIVTGDARGLGRALTAGEPTPIEYASPMPAEVLAEDEEIAAFPLAIAEDSVEVIALERVFAS